MASAPTHEEEVEWVISTVRGMQFRKVRQIRVGDRILVSKRSTPSHLSPSKQPLPRTWHRFLSSFVTLLELQASPPQISHYLHVSLRSFHDDDLLHFQHLLSNGRFGSTLQNKISNDHSRLLMKQFEQELNGREGKGKEKERGGVKRYRSLVDSSNRKEDKRRVQNEMSLPELGYDECGIQFFNRDSQDVQSPFFCVPVHVYVYGPHPPLSTVQCFLFVLGCVGRNHLLFF